MSQVWPAVSQPVSRHTQHQGHACAPCRSAPAPCCALPHMLQRPFAMSKGFEHRIAAPGCTISLHKVAPLSAMTQLLYHDPAPSCTHCASYCRPPGRIVAEQWSRSGLLRRVVTHPCALPPSHARHDTMHCIVTQHQNGQ